MCLRFCSFILIRQSDSHLSTTERWFASCVVDRPGHLERLKIAVSSANVDVVSCSFVGISAVYRILNRMLEIHRGILRCSIPDAQMLCVFLMLFCLLVRLFHGFDEIQIDEQG